MESQKSEKLGYYTAKKRERRKRGVALVIKAGEYCKQLNFEPHCTIVFIKEPSIKDEIKNHVVGFIKNLKSNKISWNDEEEKMWGKNSRLITGEMNDVYTDIKTFLMAFDEYKNNLDFRLCHVNVKGKPEIVKLNKEFDFSTLYFI